jgi:hypothetical protein
MPYPLPLNLLPGHRQRSPQALECLLSHLRVSIIQGRLIFAFFNLDEGEELCGAGCW